MKTRTKIFLTLLLTYGFFTNTYLTTNDASRFSLTAAIVEEQSFGIENFLEEVISEHWLPKDYAIYEGRTYSDKAPLGSFLGIPAYFITKFFTADISFLIYFVSLSTSGILTVLTSLLIYDLGKYFTDKKSVWIALSLSYGMGSMAFFYATVFFSQAITAFLLFASFYLLFKAKHEGFTTRKFMLSGALAGLAVSSDYYAGVVVIALLFYMLRIDFKKSYAFILPFFFGLSLLLIYHWAVFEDPFTVSYLHSNLYGKYHSTGLYGIRLLDAKLLLNLASHLFAVWGFLFTNPLLLLSFLALRPFVREYREESLTLLIMSAGLLYVTGSIAFFDAYSSRFLAPLVPFLYLPLYKLNLSNNKVALLLSSLLVLGVIINLAGADTFLPENPHPDAIRQTYGNHNIVGEFLLIKGFNLHHLTLIPLFIICALIWREEISDGIEKIIRPPE